MRCDTGRYTVGMSESLLLVLLLAAVLVAVVLLVLLLWRRPDAALQQALREEQREGRSELRAQLDSFSTQQELRIDGFASRLNEAAGRTDQRLEDLREALTEDARKARQETALALKDFAAALDRRVGELTRNNEQRIGEMRATLEQRLRDLQQDNAAKLEQMRATVDEKLHATLETRLSESFGNVTAMLAQVHQPRSCRITSKSVSTSRASSDEVGSSMMTARASTEMARAMATICWTPRPRERRGAVTSAVMP